MGMTITISCDDCIMQGTAACADCVVTHVCDRRADEPLVLHGADVLAMRLLADAGLVPGLRHARR
jgi:hypothetical protein